MNHLSKNNIAMLGAVIIMMLIAATFGYRLQISAGGLVFERTDSGKSITSKRSPDGAR